MPWIPSGLFWLVWGLSALTLTTGVGAGVVFAPVFLLFFQMSPAMATGTSILIQAAGVGTTAVGHLREGTTDRPLAVQLASAGTFGLVVGRITYELIPHIGAEMHDSRGGVASICATQTSHPRRPLSGTGPAIGILMLAMAAGLTMSEVLL